MFSRTNILALLLALQAGQYYAQVSVEESSTTVDLIETTTTPAAIDTTSAAPDSTTSDTITTSAEVITTSASASVNVLPSNTTTSSAPANTTSVDEDADEDLDVDHVPMQFESTEDQEIYTLAETAYYVHQVSLNPAEGEAPVQVPQCSGNTKRSVFARARPPKPPTICTLKKFTVPYQFWFVSNRTAAAAGVTNARIAAQMRLVGDAYSPHAISFTSLGNLRELTAPAYAPPFKGYSQMSINLRKNNRVQPATRNILNVYVVEDLRGGKDKTLNGFATFPWDTKTWSVDGIVLDFDTLPVGEPNISVRKVGPPLIHEIGHWLGLWHTFSAENNFDCGDISIRAEKEVWETLDDGASDTPLTAGMDAKDANGSSIAMQCTQPVCITGGGATPQSQFINNWMSYTRCRGWISSTNKAMSRAGFSKQQRARMYAAWTKWRVPWKKISTAGCPDISQRVYSKRQTGNGDVVAFDLSSVYGSLQDPRSACVSNTSFVSTPATFPVPASDLPQASTPAGTEVSSGGATSGSSGSSGSESGKKSLGAAVGVPVTLLLALLGAAAFL